jgi:hypothetical protein
LAFLTSLAVGVFHGEPPDRVLLSAWFSLVMFSAVGYIVGRIAAQTVEESVRAKISAQLGQEESKEPSGAMPKA